jgi:HSP20 family protein
MKMSLVRWNPSRDLRGLEEEMERLFEGMWQARGELPEGAPARAWRPGADIRETAEDIYVRVDLPGVDAKDVKVSIFGDTLTVRGERREETNEKDVKWHRVERFHGEFERSFQLGASVQGDKVAAAFKDGVLEIRIPKAESARPREIPVQVARN